MLGAIQLAWFDIAAFVGFLGVVIGISLYASRKEETTEDYFLAGRNLSWWLIGFSLIASNISSEHFVGMAGKGYSLGLAIASYEWIAAASLVIAGIFLLPKFLRSGIYTIPEYLEYRFSAAPRAIMAFYLMVAFVVVAIAMVLCAGAKALNSIFDMPLVAGVWMIGLIAGAYTIYGGLKAVVWSDLLQGAALLIGGVIVTVIGFHYVGGVDVFFEKNADKLHMILPADHGELPWTIFLCGIWIPNLFYWGLNQYITQRTLAAKSLSQGQRGVMLAAAIKLGIPFIIIFPGIMAFQLYGGTGEITDPDKAYPYMLQKILPVGLRGIMFAALFGAVMSSLDSMLNSASTIFTIDLYKRHFRPNASAKSLVRIGRIATGVFVIVGCLWAPLVANFGQLFDYIQKFWGFITPAILTVFLYGMVVRKAPPLAAVVGLLLGPVLYGLFLWQLPETAFLTHMAFVFVALVIVMTVITALRPMREAKEMPAPGLIDLTPSRMSIAAGVLILAATLALYILFW